MVPRSLGLEQAAAAAASLCGAEAHRLFRFTAALSVAAAPSLRTPLSPHDHSRSVYPSAMRASAAVASATATSIVAPAAAAFASAAPASAVSSSSLAAALPGAATTRSPRRRSARQGGGAALAAVATYNLCRSRIAARSSSSTTFAASSAPRFSRPAGFLACPAAAVPSSTVASQAASRPPAAAAALHIAAAALTDPFAAAPAEQPAACCRSCCTSCRGTAPDVATCACNRELELFSPAAAGANTAAVNDDKMCVVLHARDQTVSGRRVAAAASSAMHLALPATFSAARSSAACVEMAPNACCAAAAAAPLVPASATSSPAAQTGPYAAAASSAASSSAACRPVRCGHYPAAPGALFAAAVTQSPQVLRFSSAVALLSTFSRTIISPAAAFSPSTPASPSSAAAAAHPFAIRHFAVRAATAAATAAGFSAAPSLSAAAATARSTCVSPPPAAAAGAAVFPALPAAACAASAAASASHVAAPVACPPFFPLAAASASLAAWALRQSVRCYDSRWLHRLERLREPSTYAAPPLIRETETIPADHIHPLLRSVTPSWNSRRCGVLGYKVGMLSLWDGWGERHPITVVQVDRCVVLDNRTLDKDGYEAVVLGIGYRPLHRVSKPLLGHYMRANVEPKQRQAEFKCSSDCLLPVGHELSVRHFSAGQYVFVSGFSKEKGYLGVNKRWGFAGQNRSHGVEAKAHSSPGSIGQSKTVNVVWRFKKMAGHAGGDPRVVNCKVFRIETQRNLLFLRGCIPGYRGSVVKISDARGKSHYKYNRNIPLHYPTFVPQPDVPYPVTLQCPDTEEDPFLYPEIPIYDKEG